MTQVSTTLSNPWWNQFQKIKCTYKWITLNKYIYKMHCQLAETCRNEVENNIIINGSILNVLWTEVICWTTMETKCQALLWFSLPYCYMYILNYKNNYNQGNYFLDQLGRLQSISVHTLHICSTAVQILRQNLSGN